MLDNLLFLRNYAFSGSRKISYLLANRDALKNESRTDEKCSLKRPSSEATRSRAG